MRTSVERTVFPWPAVLLAVWLGLGVTACGRESASSPVQRPLPPVVVTAVRPGDVDIHRDFPARVHGARQVEVRARVQGILQEKRYVEGQWVDRNEILFVIDPEPFRIAVRRAEAELATTRADHDHAVKEYRRVAGLFEHKAVSERDRDQAQTTVDVAKARMDMARAALDDARTNLGYTQVRAPISGVTGMEDLSEGNLVQWGALLTTITQDNPVQVRFALPERDAETLRTTRRAMSGADNAADNGPATLLLADGGAYAQPGVIDFTAGTIDTRTGTVSARAVFANPDYELVPGQFVRIRVHLRRLTNVTRVPETVVGQGADGPRVFVVGPDDKAFSRTVRLGPVVDGDQVILEGLAPGDRVVTVGHVALRDGMPVATTNVRQAGEAR